jgi:hypothetical protein
MTDADLRAYNDTHSQGLVASAWSATTDWISHNWEYIAAGAAIAAGVALMFTGIGGPAGLILIGAASGALISGGAAIATQKATTGTIDWGQVGKATIEGAALGAATGGVFLTAGKLLTTSRLTTLTRQAPITEQTTTALTPVQATQAAAQAEPGAWIQVSESMSARAAAYQEQITGRSANWSYEVNGLKFDGFDNILRELLEAKGPGYERFVRDGEFVDWFTGARPMLIQALNQTRVAGGLPIVWSVAEAEAAAAIRQLFKENSILGIALEHVPWRGW